MHPNYTDMLVGTSVVFKTVHSGANLLLLLVLAAAVHHRTPATQGVLSLRTVATEHTILSVHST